VWLLLWEGTGRYVNRQEDSKPIGLLIVITGALGLVAAGVTLRMVSAEPKSERLTVSAVTPAGPGNLGGTPVANQVKAYAPEGMNQGAGDRVMVLSGSRASLTNGSLLRALVHHRAIALGVAASAIGIGVL